MDSQKTNAYGVKIFHKFNAFEFQSLSSMTDTDAEISYDADWGNPLSHAPYIYDYFSETIRNRKTWSQEFRLFQIQLILTLAKKLSGLLGLVISMLLNKILKMMMEHMGIHWTPSALISANPPQQANFPQIIYRFLAILIIFLTSRLN